MMRDGVSSVTRMYINVFRDTNRFALLLRKVILVVAAGDSISRRDFF